MGADIELCAANSGRRNCAERQRDHQTTKVEFNEPTCRVGPRKPSGRHLAHLTAHPALDLRSNTIPSELRGRFFRFGCCTVSIARLYTQLNILPTVAEPSDRANHYRIGAQLIFKFLAVQTRRHRIAMAHGLTGQHGPQIEATAVLSDRVSALLLLRRGIDPTYLVRYDRAHPLVSAGEEMDRVPHRRSYQRRRRRHNTGTDLITIGAASRAFLADPELILCSGSSYETDTAQL